MKKNLVFLSLLVLFPTASMAMPPAIHSVDGVLDHGQILTVTGINLVAENTAAWSSSAAKGLAPFNPSRAGFEGDSLIADGWVDSATSGTYVTDIKLQGKQAFYLNNSNWQRCSGYVTSCGGNRIFRYFYDFPSNSTKYFSAYIRFHGKWARHYQKMILSDSADNKGSGLFYFQPKTDEGHPPRRLLIKAGARKVGKFDIPEGGFDQQKWHYVEWKIARGTSNTSLQVWWDHKEIANVLIPSLGDSDINWMELGIPNWSKAVGPMKMWLDRYVDSSARIYPAAKIEIGNKAIYGQGSEKWQTPVYLSDDKIQFELDLRGLGAGPYYLWITNNRLQRSIGYKLTK